MEQLSLHWSNYQHSVSTVFQDLRLAEQLTDVTISTMEGNSMKAHRVVLCAASSYFRDLLAGTNCWQHPVLIIKDLPYSDLTALLEFIYTGSVSIPPDNLQSLLNTAKFLSISGLSSKNPQSTSSGGKKRKVGIAEVSIKVQKKEVNGNDQKQHEDLPVKMEPLDIDSEEFSCSYARANTDTIGTNTAEETDRLVAADTENDFHASRNITGNFEDRRDNLADTDTSGDTGPLTCLVCRASLSNYNALYYHMNYVHSGGVEPGDIIRNMETVLGEGVKTEER